ncbi:ABC transporter substrate-binding protein [Deinococcus fonticola]|uniref:ABC transporter substrate-binding protein n=1 Tax=Deinococcus fonticola TaxID=2528713 RepID=UPI0030B805C6
MYDTLGEFKPGTTTLDPGLATRWAASADMKNWTFTLRRNVKFHDGTPFNADAVIFNVERWWNPASPARYNHTWESWGQILGESKGKGSVLAGIKKNNDYSLTFNLTRPVSDFPARISTSFFGIASPAAVKKAGEKYGSPAGGAVGTGPYVLDSWKTGDRIVLKANPSYWRGKPRNDGVLFRFLKDPSARLNELRAGTLDLSCDLNPADLKAVQGDPKLTAILRPSFNVGMLNIYTGTRKELQDVRVRRAIMYAINRPAIVDAFWGPLGATDNSIVPPALGWANSKNVPNTAAPNVAQAKKLLAEAGYANGLTLDLWYMPVSRPYFPTPKPIAEAIAADLAAVGIKTHLKTEDWAKYLEDSRQNPGFDLYMLGWSGSYGSPSTFYDPHFGPGGEPDTAYENKALQKLLDNATAAKNQSEAAKIYAKAQELAYESAVRIMMVHSRPLCASRKNVTGWTPNPTNSDQFDTVVIK